MDLRDVESRADPFVNEVFPINTVGSTLMIVSEQVDRQRDTNTYKRSSCAAEGAQSNDRHQRNNIKESKELSKNMAPSHMDYPHNAQQSESENVGGYSHKKFNTDCYKHKKFGKRISKDDTPTAPPLFRPYALSENTPRKRRQELQQPQQYQLPPTPPTTPPQQQQQKQQQQHLFQQPQQQHLYQQQQQPHQQQQQFYVPTATPTPVFNHQAYAYVLQKQRTVLQMRQMLSINPDANTWPTELRNALYSMLQQ